jgi:geranylgeranyl transferase type-2 subunit alpha
VLSWRALPLPRPRSYVAHLAGASASAELAFARAKIDANFSNYSAWHYRAALLPAALAAEARAQADAATQPRPDSGPDGADAAAAAAAARFAGPFHAAPSAADAGADGGAAGALPSAALAEEFELVANAFYTEPEDTAGWVFHDWLVGKALQAAALQAAEAEAKAGGGGSADGAPTDAGAAAASAAAAAAWRGAAETLAGEAARMRELIAMEPGARWPALALARLLAATADCRRRAGAPEDATWRAEAAALYEALLERDPMRAGYYRDCLAKLRGGA